MGVGDHCVDRGAENVGRASARIRCGEQPGGGSEQFVIGGGAVCEPLPDDVRRVCRCTRGRRVGQLLSELMQDE